MDIGSNIKAFRNSHKLSRRAMSEITGVSPAFIEEIESGKKVPSIEILMRISSAFNITVSELIGETQTEITPELKDLLDNAKQLPPDKIAILNDFIEQFALGHKPKYVKTTVDGKELSYTYNEDERPAPTPEEEKEANDLANQIIEMARKDPEARKRFEAEGFVFHFDEDK